MQKLFLIINVGSTSIKSRLFDHALCVKAFLNADYSANGSLLITGEDSFHTDFKQHFTKHYDARATLRVLLEHWQHILAQQQWTLSAIGHRIVHGGADFSTISLITHDVLKRITALDGYAPLHNPLNHLGVTIAGKTFPDIPQYAVFDTAFHRRIPQFAGRYAIPAALSANVEFYRYGFHGISCQHSVTAAAALLNVEPEVLNLIILHLGGGCSITAVQNGCSVDTSMGFSPMEGLIMASRCGDIDPMIPVTLLKEGMPWQQLDELLNHHSGLTGICGESDMRMILQHLDQPESAARLAFEMFCYRIKKYLGAYTAVLGKVNAVVFTGGIGEHAPLVREQSLQGLDNIGYVLDDTANRIESNHNRDIGASNSSTRIVVIAAEEEREIARQMLVEIEAT